MPVDTVTEPSDTHGDAQPVPTMVIVMLVAVVAATSLASLFMSFHGLRDLVERAEGVAGWLSSVGPFGIDGLQIGSLFGIVVTSGAPFKVRFYLWCVFLGSIGVSTAMNASDAVIRHAGLPGVVLSGFWPVLLAAATHVLVVAIRWWLESRQIAELAATEPATEYADEPDTVPTPKPKPPATAKQIQAWARQRYARGGVSCKQVAEAMTGNGYPVSEKQVERWTKDLRISSADLRELTSGTDIEVSS